MRGHRGTRQGLDFPDHETSTETDRWEGSPEISEVNGQNEQLQDGFDPAAAPSRCQFLTHTRVWGGGCGGGGGQTGRRPLPASVPRAPVVNERFALSFST